MRDQVVNGGIKCQQMSTCSTTQLPHTESASMTSPLQYIQQRSPDFSVNGIHPRTSSNASSIAGGFENDTLQFRDRSASNASSCGGGVGATGHYSPPSLADYSEQESLSSGVCTQSFFSLYIFWRLFGTYFRISYESPNKKIVLCRF